ncbi:protein kinase [Streptomyces sp. NBC_01373]|uniref:protein kinase domain-containing protein n=1 Tax=Streptomyces sp. NBC_01373 TaxID=2903843 RepID=UPI00225631A7|nr:protein kinase [Streptomyces sp. NBC_01373]MCX4705986.1 protein kinase [Streptomyces sp. NBC_01373]
MSDASSVWAVGEVVAGLYEVVDVHAQGGMGLVYRVRHQGWRTDLAVKSPRPEMFVTEAARRRFVEEAEVWVSLGLHPHVCACHYVRTLGGVPRVFAEYVAGGSLRDRIDDRSLYRGGHAPALARILDIAIQVAWGLNHAHTHGVVHQDMKPGNILLEPDWTAKVSDFGLARARAATLSQASEVPGAASILVSAGGMTPAYASPEQATGQRVGRRSDVFSFAVSLLELFTGGVTWRVGFAARAALRELLRRGPARSDLPPLPADLADLLGRCLDDDPARRPADLADIAAQLRDTYRRHTGQPHPRPVPGAAELRADELNNRALSLLDLGRPTEARAAFDEALSMDPQHLEATYNRGVLLWRAGELTDDVLVHHLEDARATAAEPWVAGHLLALVHLERGDVATARALLTDAVRQSGGDAEVADALRTAMTAPVVGAGDTSVNLGPRSLVTDVCAAPDRSVALSAEQSFSSLALWDLRTGERMAARYLHCIMRSIDLGNERYALIGERDGTLHLYDAFLDQPLRRFQGHSDEVTAVRLSPDGRTALSGDMKGVIRYWDLEEVHCLHVFEGDDSPVLSLVISADGRVAVSGHTDGNVRVWDLRDGTRVHALRGHTDVVVEVCLSVDGRFLLTGGQDGTLRIWDPADGRCLHERHTDGGTVQSVRVSLFSRWVLTGHDDGSVRIWDPENGRCLRTFAGHTKSVQSVWLSTDDRWALSGSQDGTMRLRELPASYPAGCAPRLCRPRSTAELDAVAARAQRLLADAEQAVGEDRLVDAHTLLTRARALPGHERAPRLMAAWAALTRSSVRTGVRAARPARTLRGHSSWALGAGLSGDGRLAVSHGAFEETVRIWDVGTGTCRHVLEGHTSGVSAVCLTSDGTVALSGSADTTVRVWDVDTGRCRHVLTGHGGSVTALDVTRDGRFALSADHSSQLRLWDLADGGCLATMTVPGGKTLAAMSADGRRAVTGGYDGVVRVWDLTTGQQVRTMNDHYGSVLAVSLSADGRTALSGGQDGLGMVWDVDTGERLQVLDGHTHVVMNVALTLDGRFGLTASGDATICVWDVQTGRRVQVLKGHSAALTAVSVGADARFVLSAGHDRTLRLWELDWHLQARDPADWDEGARAWLEIHAALRTPLADTGPSDGTGRLPSRSGTPVLTDTDVEELLLDLQHAGYGWLRPEGVRAQLDVMGVSWAPPGRGGHSGGAYSPKSRAPFS